MSGQNSRGKMITVFTPTYNRAYTLHKCYESLCAQTAQTFVWLVVDDGSTDHTKALVNEWINENIIPITYIYQENQGKHVAHNTGVAHTQTEIFVCVDSDDYLTENAIEIICSQWEIIRKNDRIAGIIALRGKTCENPIGTKMPGMVLESSLFDLYEKYKFRGDTVIFLKSDVIRKFPFPVFKGERFVTEAAIWDLIDQTYTYVLHDEILYICEYLPDGLTKNIYKTILKSPNGYIYFMQQRVRLSRRFKDKYKSYARLITWSKVFKRNDLLKGCGVWRFFVWPAVFLWYRKIQKSLIT